MLAIGDSAFKKLEDEALVMRGALIALASRARGENGKLVYEVHALDFQSEEVRVSPDHFIPFAIGSSCAAQRWGSADRHKLLWDGPDLLGVPTEEDHAALAQKRVHGLQVAQRSFRCDLSVAATRVEWPHQGGDQCWRPLIR